MSEDTRPGRQDDQVFRPWELPGCDDVTPDPFVELGRRVSAAFLARVADSYLSNGSSDKGEKP